MRNITTVQYRTWLKATRKYQNLRERLSGEPDANWHQKLTQLRRRIIRMNRRWQLGVASGVLVAWLAMPVGGQAQEAPAQFELANLNGNNGFVVSGNGEDDALGRSVSEIGDINGDGLDDFVVGAPDADANGKSRAGKSYVIFGQGDGQRAALDVTALDGSNGFVVNGVNTNDRSGTAVSGAGDVNGDGLDDLIIGAPGGGYAGESYVVFGSDDGFEAELNLSILRGSTTLEDGTVVFNDDIGFVIAGKETGRLGESVSGAGDVNGDGLDDIIVGAFTASPNGSLSGQSYVIFGQPDGLGPGLPVLDVDRLDGNDGFAINGKTQGDRLGRSVSGAGDVNGDGFDDVIVGAEFAFSGSDLGNAGNVYAGESYVVFGGENFDAEIDAVDLNGSNGFAILGLDRGDRLGRSVSGAGDINGDGLDDVIVGAPGATTIDQYNRTNQRAGESYVLFGSRSGFDAAISVGELDGSNGFTIEGDELAEYSGAAVSGAGDVDGDGLDDVVIGAPYANFNETLSSNGIEAAGESYVIFGSDSGFDAVLETAELDGSNGFTIGGAETGDRTGGAVSGAGDINGDGLDDVLIGANYGGVNQAYVVFGSSSASEREAVVTRLSLVRSDNEQVLGTLQDGDVLDIATFGTSGFDVDAITTGDNVARVEFDIKKPDGSVVRRTERSAPYVLFGHRGRDFIGMIPIPGEYTLTVSPFIEGSNGQTIPGKVVTVNFSFTGRPAVISRLSLVRADNEQVLGTLEDGDVLDLATFGTSGFDVDAITRGDNNNIARIDFSIQQPDGTTIERTERSAPYVLFGHNGRDFLGADPMPGAYTLTVSPFVRSEGQVVPGQVVTVDFTFTGQSGSLLVYPNSFENELFVQTGRQEGELQLRFQSVMSGQTYEVTADKMSQIAEGVIVNTEGLPAGHYILQLVNSKETKMLHVIKQ